MFFIPFVSWFNQFRLQHNCQCIILCFIANFLFYIACPLTLYMLHYFRWRKYVYVLYNLSDSIWYWLLIFNFMENQNPLYYLMNIIPINIILEKSWGLFYLQDLVIHLELFLSICKKYIQNHSTRQTKLKKIIITVAANDLTLFSARSSHSTKTTLEPCILLFLLMIKPLNPGASLFRGSKRFP